MKPNSRILQLAFLLPALWIAGGCDDVSTQGIGGVPSLVVAMTDDPFPWTSVSRADVYVSSIDISTTDADQSVVDDTSASAGWINMARPNRRIDLVALRNGEVAILGEVSPTSSDVVYRSVRVVIVPDSSSITLTDSSQLTVANGGLTFDHHDRQAIKTRLDAPIDMALGSGLALIDFDLAGSFLLRGSTPQSGFQFRPQLRTTLRTQLGAVNGTVVDALTGAGIAGATVQLVLPGTAYGDSSAVNLFASSVTDSAGAYSFPFVPDGSYAVRVIPPSSGFNLGTVTHDNTVVTAGQTTTVPPIALF